jgi:hypothetical protein
VASIYFWNIEALKARLTGEVLSPGAALSYLLGHSVLWGGGTLLVAVEPQDWNVWDLTEWIVSVVLLVPGLLLAFHQNGGRAGHDFLGRVLSVAWVVGFRVYVPSLIGVVGLLWMLSASGPIPDETTWLESLAWVAVQVLFYWRLSRHMGDLRRASRAA